MQICWVTNEVWFSRLLRFLFKEESSHVGVTFSIDNIWLAVDVNRPYGTVWAAKYWRKKYKLVWQLTLNLPKEKELELFKACESYAVLKKYDMPGYYYGMYCGLLQRLFGIPLPKENKFSRPGSAMCQEIINAIITHPIAKEYGVVSEAVDLSVMTPDMSREFMRQLTESSVAWKWSYYG